MGRFVMSSFNGIERSARTAFRAGTSIPESGKAIMSVLAVSAALWLTLLSGSANAASVTYYGNAQAGTSVGVNGTTNLSPLNDYSITRGTSNNYRLQAATTAPSGSTRYRIREGSGSAWTQTDQEMYRFYTPSYTDANRSIGANVAVHADLYMNATGGTSASAKAVLYEYNDATGIVGAAKGTATFTLNVGTSSLQTMNANFANPAFIVASGNRLLVIFFLSANNARPAYLWGQAAGTSGPSGYESITVSESASGACTANAATVAITPSPQTITTNGGSALYSVTITNNDSGSACASVSFNLAASDSSAVAFNASTLNSTTVTLAPGATSAPVTLTVSAKAGQTTGSDTTTVTAAATGHANGTGTVSTTLSVPVCTAGAPTVSIAPASQTITASGGSVTYAVTVTNTDTGAGCGSVTYAMSASDSNTASFNASTLSLSSVTLAPGATSASITLTVSGKAGQTTGTDGTTVSAAAPGHATGTRSVTTTLNVSASGTNAGTATIQPGDDTLHVTALYTGDLNGNNTLKVEWGLCAGGTCNGTTFTGTTTLAHAASPYSYLITGLTNNAKYQVRVTYQDADGVSGTAAQTSMNLITMNPLLHNSVNTSSSKWTAQGGWGVSGGKYGQIVCETCHAKTTANIKRIKSTISTPDGSNWNSTGSPNAAVVFQSAQNGTSDFGDDTGGHTTSNKVCEVCHSLNKYHNYNTANNTGGTTHNNRSDCTTCHSHSTGFLPLGGCDSCHGNPPTATALGGSTGLVSPATGILGASPANAGAHATHVTTRSMKCEVCHTGSTMPALDNRIEMGFAINAANFGAAGLWGAAAAASGVMTLHTPTAPYSFQASAGTTINADPGYTNTCSVYCHGSTLTGGSIAAPSWTGASQAACGACHGASTATPPTNWPTTLSHGTHAGNLKLACSACHPAVADNSHVNGSVAWSLATGDVRFGSTAMYNSAASGQTNGLAPSATYGSCANLYCHSSVQGTNGVGAGTSVSVQWGNSASVNCGSCHKNMATDAAAPGRHVKHANAGVGNYNMACSTCHPGYTASSANNTTHANNTIEVALPSGSYNGGTTAGNHAAGGGYGTCSTNYCHSTAQSAAGLLPATYLTPTWGGTGSLGCGGCHLDMDTNTSAPGSHVQHAQGAVNIPCATCHNGFGTETTVTVATHANGTINLAFTGNAAGTTYQLGNSIAPGAGYGNCTTNNCHGANSGTWGTNTTNAQCTKCHGVPGTTLATFGTDSRTAAPGYIRTGTTVTGVDTSGSFGTIVNNVSTDAQVGAHNAHLNSAVRNYSAPIACSNCHAVPASIDITGADGHLNAGPAEIVFSGLATANGATASYTSPNCNNTYCHFGKSINGYSPAVTGAAVSWTNTSYLNGTTADCQKCHLSPPSTTGTHAGKVFPADCNGCHSHVSTTGVITDPTKHINGVVDASGGSCIGCHASVQTGTHGTPRDAVVAEFGLAWGHKKSGRGAVTNADCIVCHLEGNYATQSTSAVHMDGKIDLRDPDGAGETPITNISGGTFTFTKFAVSYAAGSRTPTGHLSDTDIANVLTQKFCLACHDSNGATNPTARTTGGTQYMPWSGVNLGTNYTVANGAAAAGGVVDVKTQLATTNSSRHPVLGPLTRDFPYSTRLLAPYNNIGTARDANGTTGHTTANSVVLNCFDCHNSSTTLLTNRTIVAHGGTETLRGTTYTTTATLCNACHTGYTNSSNHSTGSAWALTGSSHNVSQNCHYCHGSNTTSAKPARPLPAQDYHGSNAKVGGGLWPTTNSRPYAFIRGWSGTAYHRPYRSSEFTTGSATCGAGTCPGGGQVGDGNTRTYTPGGTY